MNEKEVNEVKTVQIDIKTANETVKGLNETIKVLTERLTSLQIKEQNLNNDIHSLQIRKDQTMRQDNTKVEVRLLEGKNKLEAERAKFESYRRSFDIKEKELEKRISDVETREKEIVDIDRRYKELNEERQRFNHYKFNIEGELDEAKIIIEEAKVEENRLEGIKSELEGKEKLLESKWKDFSDNIGELEEKEKKIKAEIEQLEGLKKWYEQYKKEVGNGKGGNRFEKVGEFATRN